MSNILQLDDVELAFVWNRHRAEVQSHVDNAYILESLDDFSER